MKNWIRATFLAVTGVLLALVAIPSLSYLVRVAVGNSVGDDVVATTHDVLALAAVIALIVVSMVRVIAVVGRTDRWTPLSKSIVAWDGMIATVFLWAVLDERVAWFRGPWELPVALVIMALLGTWGIEAIMHAAPPPLEIGLSGKGPGDAADEEVTHGNGVS